MYSSVTLNLIPINKLIYKVSIKLLFLTALIVQYVQSKNGHVQSKSGCVRIGLTMGSWVDKGATDKNLTRYSNTRSGETRLEYEYVLMGLAGKRAKPTQTKGTVRV